MNEEVKEGFLTDKFLCRRCGQKIPHGDNGMTSRSLAIYCPTCAEIIAERMVNRNRIAPPVRTVRVRNGHNGWTEYRGTWSSAIFRGRETLSNQTLRL